VLVLGKNVVFLVSTKMGRLRQKVVF